MSTEMRLIAALKLIADSEEFSSDTFVCDFSSLQSVARAALKDVSTPPAAQVQGEQPDSVETAAFVPGSLADLLFQLGEKGVSVSGGTHGDRWRVRLPQAALSAPPAAGVPEIPAQWAKSLSHCWPQYLDDKDGDWCVGTIDEDGHLYEVLLVEAAQYDAPGESQKIAEAIVALWSFSAAPTPPASEQQQAVVMPKITGTAIVEVISGVEGPSLYIGDEDGGYRLAGPKPCGGGRTIHKFKVKLDELVREAMDLAAPAQGGEL